MKLPNIVIIPTVLVITIFILIGFFITYHLAFLNGRTTEQLNQECITLKEVSLVEKTIKTTDAIVNGVFSFV